MAMRAGTMALTVGCWLAWGAGAAQALPLPDSSSCNQSGMTCLQVSNTSSGGNAGAISGTVELGTAVVGVGRGQSFGVSGTTDSAYGVVGGSNGRGVGVLGTSRSGDGIEAIGQTSGKSAVFAHNEASNGGFGVFATAKGTGVAIHGANSSSSGWAGQFVGKVVATSFTTSSDARLKQNVAALPYGTQEVMKLRPVSYEWKNEDARGDHRQLGLIAQEVRGVLPELVDADRSSGMLSVDYSALTPVLIKAVQEQQRTITTQQTQLREQASRISALEARQQPFTAASLLGAGDRDLTVLALSAIPFGLFLVLRRRRR